ncbi:hypothetical protein OCS_05900 [Ophiocordyceps sinensis CO18]|uniref:Uncharacterized protein n=1 Tax=Ophiocordyceps sinensis (strain Co18 / CGMCC 3.14243) TaxID=911162 RepID=T5A9A0_OPHSC|nr:hypothetical protein OCS_05900 [Ophiocordyceps sinensis CO18]
MSQPETKSPREPMPNPNNRVVELPKPRARHQVKRSLSELTSPAGLSRHNHPLRHHPSYGHDNDRGLLDVQAPLQTRHSISLFRPAGVASVMSPDLSRRPSLSAKKDDVGEAETKYARDARLQLEQEKASIRADVLKQSLGHLATFSTDTSNQLDLTYYAVLEKMSTLQNTVTAMKGLAEGLRDLCDGFDNDSRALESDTVSQLAALGRFEEHESKISSLQDRVRQGRARMQSLTDRVDVVRERIEGWERADRDWQGKTRKRLIKIKVGIKYNTI